MVRGKEFIGEHTIAALGEAALFDKIC